ncbi:hypothetical protein [Tumebacillus lipolyticus]|uniref:Uncharacterized protein n=1 Tax=Tumebacillus lipolyticus TaxID=1280370 RepID=A0ABW5A261_9BACL
MLDLSTVFNICLIATFVLTIWGVKGKSATVILFAILFSAVVTVLGSFSIGIYLLLIPLLQISLFIQMKRKLPPRTSLLLQLGVVAVWGLIVYAVI